MWLYGSGFPKSLAVDKALDKHAGITDWKETVPNPAWRAGNGVGMKTSSGWDKPQRPPKPIVETDIAKQWQGWGTALKPATENIIMAYKPHGTEHGIIIANLQKLEAQLWLMQYACSAEWSSTSSPSELGVALSIAQWTVAELISTRDDLLGQMDTLQLSEMANMCLSIVQSWKNTWEEASKLGNTFITETVLSPIIGWTTLKSSLSHLTLNFIIREWTQHDTEWLNVLSAASPFIVASKKLKSTLELIAVESAISRTSNPADIDARITVEPIVVARKPLQGTVADNVTAWGVGALNIDGCRVPSDDGFEKAWDKPVRTNISNGSATFDTGKSAERGTHAVDISANKPTGGRWPANIIFDEEAAQMLDEQSGVSKSGIRTPTGKSILDPNTGWNDNSMTDITTRGFFDSGGASRFFYVAKASKAEREAGLDAPDGKRANIHTTVKPIALMRYLVRMVTPKGGIVLDPFMGSGSTGKAAVLEGFSFIGIEREAEYIAIAEARMPKTYTPDLFSHAL